MAVVVVVILRHSAAVAASIDDTKQSVVTVRNVKPDCCAHFSCLSSGDQIGDAID